MRRAILSLIAVTLVPGVARAQQSTSIHGTGEVTFGYSDNLLAEPSDPQPGQPGPRASRFARVAPGLALVHETRRVQHVLTFVHAANLALDIEGEQSSSDTVRWESFLTLSARDELTLAAFAERSSTRIAALSQPAGQGTSSPQTFTDDELLTFGASERYARDLSSRWRFNQSASLDATTPYRTEGEQPTRLYPRVGSGLALMVERNAFALQAEGGAFWHSSYGEGDDREPSATEVLVELRGEWTHDLTPVWSTFASFGAAGSTLAHDPSTLVAALVWRGAVRFDDDGYAAELGVERSVVPNLLLAQVLLSDQVSASGELPLVRPWQVYVQSTLAYAHHRTLNVERGGYANEFDTGIADVATEWRPDGLPWVALRYQHQRQLGDETGEIPVLPFQRNTVSITAGYMFPPRELPRVPVVPPRRVDGGDRDPSAPAGAGGHRSARR